MLPFCIHFNILCYEQSILSCQSFLNMNAGFITIPTLFADRLLTIVGNNNFSKYRILANTIRKESLLFGVRSFPLSKLHKA